MTEPEKQDRPVSRNQDAREPLIVLDGVNKWFGDLHVLKDINLTVGKGEVVVVIGPSGSGKSTLCRAINRLETIDSGTIVFDGQPIPEEKKALALARLRSQVGMVFQSFNLFPQMTVLDNITLGPRKVRGKKAAEERAAVCSSESASRESGAISGAALGRAAAASRHSAGARDGPR